MANRLLKQFPATLEAGVVKLYGSATTSTSGTLASTATKGFSIAKTAAETGRYTITLEDDWVKLLSASVTLVGSSDAAYTGAAGIVSILRNDTVGVSGGKTVQIQWTTAVATPADAEIENGAKMLIELTLKNSTAY